MKTEARPYSVTQVEANVPTTYASFTQTFTALLGRIDTAVFAELPQLSPEVARAKLSSFVGPLDFVLFQEIDHGAILAGIYGRKKRAITYVFGNALIAVEMTKHDARAGLHVPLRLFVEEVEGGSVRVTYDLPSSLIPRLGNAAADEVARGLDANVARLLEATIARATGQV